MEKVIKDTESLFKTREKEYQETIDQIEVRVSASGALPRAPELRCRCVAGWDQSCQLLTVVAAVAGPLRPQDLEADRCGFKSCL